MGDQENTEKQELVMASERIGNVFKSGIYYLIQDDEIVYIGQSVCIMARISTHYTKKRKLFNRYIYTNVPLDKLDELELKEIIKYSPKYNSDLPGNNTYASMGKLKAHFRVPEAKLESIIEKNNIGFIETIGRRYYYLQEFDRIIKPVGRR